MNESNLEAAPVLPTSTPAYTDRSTGLTILGILTLLLGGVCGLLVPLMLIGQAMAAPANQPQVGTAALLPVIIIYSGLAVTLVWLGIGSMMARRWARALLLIFSWSWLIIGVITVISIALVIPQVLAQQPAANGTAGAPAVPPVSLVVVMVTMLFFIGIIFILLPLVWIYFYKSPNVKATCEARDPVARWTDGCPLPVLAASLWLLVGVPVFLLMPISAHGVMPFFGMFLSGLPGSLLCLVLAVVWGYTAWLLYKLDVRGWWLVLIALLVVFVSTVLTYARHDLLEAYQLMGYSQAQIDQLQKTGLLTGHRIAWMMVLWMVPWLGYILFIKKYFQPKTPA